MLWTTHWKNTEYHDTIGFYYDRINFQSSAEYKKHHGGLIHSVKLSTSIFLGKKIQISSSSSRSIIIPRKYDAGMEKLSSQ